MATRICLLLVMLVTLLQATSGFARFNESWTYKELFIKADLVVIASSGSTSPTGEHKKLTDVIPPVDVIGVSTEFSVKAVFKSSEKIVAFKLHHYRLARPEERETMVNGPELISVESRKTFLLFLVKERAGTYVPVSGQTDPAASSVLEITNSPE